MVQNLSLELYIVTKPKLIENILSFSGPGGLRASSLEALGSDIYMTLT